MGWGVVQHVNHEKEVTNKKETTNLGRHSKFPAIATRPKWQVPSGNCLLHRSIQDRVGGRSWSRLTHRAALNFASLDVIRTIFWFLSKGYGRNIHKARLLFFLSRDIPVCIKSKFNKQRSMQKVCNEISLAPNLIWWLLADPQFMQEQWNSPV